MLIPKSNGSLLVRNLFFCVAEVVMLATKCAYPAVRYGGLLLRRELHCKSYDIRLCRHSPLTARPAGTCVSVRWAGGRGSEVRTW